MNVNQIKIAIVWMYENRRGKLMQWVSDNFGFQSLIGQCISIGNFTRAAYEIYEYDLSIQLELVELMY